MKKTFLIILLLIIYSCGTKYSTDELESNFTSEEIKDLKLISDFFIKCVCSDVKSDLKNCFKKTNHDSLMMKGSGIWEKIDFEEQKKLYKKISPSTLIKFGCIVNRLIFLAKQNA